MGTQIKIEMPRISAGGDSGEAGEGDGATLASWLVAVGDEVSAGEIIAELETDKSTLELEAPAAGSLSEILVEAGTEGVTPGTLLATFVTQESAGAALDSDADPEPTEAPPSVEDSPPEAVDRAKPQPRPPAASATADASVQTPADPAAAVRSTPLARRAAQERGIDVDSLRGSGPGGRVVEADVLRQDAGGEATGAARADGAPSAPSHAGASQSSAAKAISGDGAGARADAGQSPFEAIRHSPMRKTIARRMAESKQTVPHFYLSMKCAMDEVMAVRARLNGELRDAGRELKLSVNDFIIKAAAMALRDVPQANVQFTPEAMQVFSSVGISVAVATDGGLVTPVVRQADRKSLSTIALEVKRLAERARAGALEPSEYQGGTFTISNLGMYGIETVYPIVNPPQACILGVGAAEEEAIVHEGELKTGMRARFTLAADHRAVDGAIGAELLAAFRRRIEDPLSLIL